MALIYPTIWEMGDKREQIGPGYHYKKRVRSLVVPEGQVVTIYENQDRTGKKSVPLHEGAYHHLAFYGIGDWPGVVHVEESGLTSLDLVEIGWNVSYDKNDQSKKYPMYYSIPVGDRKCKEDFPNDKIQWLCIPFGMTVEVFDEADFQGGSLIFSGNTQGEKERVNLWDYNYSWKTSSMKIRADQWVSAGTAIEEETIVSDKDTKVIATTTVANNSPHKTTASKEITATVEETTVEDWNIEAGVTAKAGFEAGTETVKATGEIEVSVSAGYGESKSKSEGREFHDIASVELDGLGTAKVSMIAEIGRMEGIAVRKWRNKRNNVIIEQRGKISASRANKVEIEIHGESGEVLVAAKPIYAAGDVAAA